jgi:hypothetical protein
MQTSTSPGSLKSWFGRTRAARNSSASAETSDGTGTDAGPDERGVAFAEFVTGQLTAEQERRVYLDTRGTGVVTTSGTFVAAVFALATFVLGRDYQLGTAGIVLIGLTLVCFVGAAIAGVVASFPRPYGIADITSLKAMTGSHWTDNPSAARRDLAAQTISSIETLRQANARKAAALVVALVAQVLAMAALSGTVAVELIRGLS